MSIKEIEKLLVESKISPETIIYKVSKHVVYAAQKHTKSRDRMKRRKLQLIEMRIQKLRTEQENIGIENQEKLIEIINEREELQSTRTIMTSKMEALHK